VICPSDLEGRGGGGEPDEPTYPARYPAVPFGNRTVPAAHVRRGCLRKGQGAFFRGAAVFIAHRTWTFRPPNLPARFQLNACRPSLVTHGRAAGRCRFQAGLPKLGADRYPPSCTHGIATVIIEGPGRRSLRGRRPTSLGGEGRDRRGRASGTAAQWWGGGWRGRTRPGADGVGFAAEVTPTGKVSPLGWVEPGRRTRGKGDRKNVCLSFLWWWGGKGGKAVPLMLSVVFGQAGPPPPTEMRS